MTWLIAAYIMGIAYVAISIFWFGFFIYTKAFSFKRKLNFLGAFAAAFFWPIGIFVMKWSM